VSSKKKTAKQSGKLKKAGKTGAKTHKKKAGTGKKQATKSLSKKKALKKHSKSGKSGTRGETGKRSKKQTSKKNTDLKKTAVKKTVAKSLKNKKKPVKSLKKQAGKSTKNKGRKKLALKTKISRKTKVQNSKAGRLEKSQPAKKSFKKSPGKSIKNSGTKATPKIKSSTPKKLSQPKKTPLILSDKVSLEKQSGPALIKKTLAFLEEELEQVLEKKENRVLKDRTGRAYCMAENCDYLALVDDYCRLHYFGFYERITKRKEILEKDLLTKQFLELVKDYSESVLNFLLKDLSSDRRFNIALKKMFLDEEINDLGENS